MNLETRWVKIDGVVGNWASDEFDSNMDAMNVSQGWYLEIRKKQ